MSRLGEHLPKSCQLKSKIPLYIVNKQYIEHRAFDICLGPYLVANGITSMDCPSLNCEVTFLSKPADCPSLNCRVTFLSKPARDDYEFSVQDL